MEEVQNKLERLCQEFFLSSQIFTVKARSLPKIDAPLTLIGNIGLKASFKTLFSDKHSSFFYLSVKYNFVYHWCFDKIG